MIFRYPAYYEKFRCIAGACEDTCCAGWEIDIDDASYQFYQQVEGDFGKYLRKNIKEYEADAADVYERHGFILQADKRCPFLNEQNLCNLYIELGEEALCDVCTNTPRNILEYGGQRELALSAACPEAGRLIYGSDEKTTFVEREIPEELDFEENESERMLAAYIRQARDQALAILQNRHIRIYDRVPFFLHYAQEVQTCLNENAPEQILQISAEKFMMAEKDSARWDKSGSSRERYELFLRRMVTFSGMESINDEWVQILSLLHRYFIEPADGEQKYAKIQKEYCDFLREQHREYEYEHLLVYYAFMCLARCVDDYDFLGKAKFAAAGFLMLRDMDTVWYAEHGSSYTKKDRVRLAGIYAKEVEHSEENLSYLAEEFLFEEAFEVSRMCLL